MRSLGNPLHLMKKIKAVGKLELLMPHIADSPEFTGVFNTTVDALHSAVADAWQHMKNEQHQATCQDVENALQQSGIDTDFGALLASLDTVLKAAGRFKRRTVLEHAIREVRSFLDANGKGPQNPIIRSIFEPITEAGLIDRSEYNEDEDVLVVIADGNNLDGLTSLVRVLPYVNARNSLLIETDEEWVEDRVEPYLTAVKRVFEEQCGTITSLQDDDLAARLIGLCESTSE